MIVHVVWLLAIFVTIIGYPTKAQDVIQAGNPNATVPMDLFADDEEFEENFPNIVALKYHIREQMLPLLITDIAMQNVQCSSRTFITLTDVANAVRLDRVTTDNLAEAIAKLNITSGRFHRMLQRYNVTPTAIQKLLQTFDLTFFDIYNKFVQSLPNPSETIPETLKILNVSVADFMNAQTYGNDTVRLKVLSTGNYSEENLIAVLNITNKTAVDMLKLLPLNATAKQLNKLNETDFTDFVKNLEISSQDLMVFYTYLNVTPINFLSHSAFIRAVTECFELLNPEEVLGTLISQNDLVTCGNARVFSPYQNQSISFLRNYASFHAELVENPLVQYSVRIVNRSSSEGHIARIVIDNPIESAFSEIATNYNQSGMINCTYVSKLPTGELVSENCSVHLDNSTVAMKKTQDTEYTLGGPLFCQDRLYGVACQENVTHVIFSTFMKKATPTSTTVITPKPTAQPPAVSEDVGNIQNITSVSSTTTPEHDSGVTLSCGLLSFILALLSMNL